MGPCKRTKLLCKGCGGIAASSRVAVNALRNTAPVYLRAGDKGAFASATMEHCVAMATASSDVPPHLSHTYTYSLLFSLFLSIPYYCHVGLQTNSEGRVEPEVCIILCRVDRYVHTQTRSTLKLTFPVDVTRLLQNKDCSNLLFTTEISAVFTLWIMPAFYRH